MTAAKDKGQPLGGGKTGLEVAGVTNQGDVLLDRAQEAEREQTALLDTNGIAGQYTSALTAEVEAKHDQVARIEDKLETLIEDQVSRLQDAQSHPPGLFSRPGARTAWQTQLQRQQAAIQRLQTRLESVREIKEGMSVTGPKLEELAARKLRHKEPELVEGWDELREAQRRHEALLRKRDQDAKKQQRGTSKSLGQTQTLIISPPR